MKFIVVATAFALLPFGSAADKPGVGRPMIASVEKNLENHLLKLWPDDPVSIVGIPEGVYINGYGVVFISQVNLAPAPGITPFHQTISKDDVTRTHQKKLDRLPKLKEAMQEMLLNSAASMDTVPADDQVTLGISLFHWYWEDTTGLPAQIVMHAPKRTLIMVKSGQVNRATLASAVTVQEF